MKNGKASNNGGKQTYYEVENENGHSVQETPTRSKNWKLPKAMNLSSTQRENGKVPGLGQVHKCMLFTIDNLLDIDRQ